MITLKVEYVVLSSGKRMIELIDFTGLSKSKTPDLYSNNGKESTCFEDTYIRFGNQKGCLNNWCIGNLVKEETFERIMTHIKKSGDNLKECNIELDRLRESWNGTKTYKI